MKPLQLHKPVFSYADMVELADTPDLGSGALRRTGSSPAIRTITKTPLRLEFMKLRFNGAFILHILHISILQYYYFFDII